MYTNATFETGPANLVAGASLVAAGGEKRQEPHQATAREDLRSMLSRARDEVSVARRIWCAAPESSRVHAFDRLLAAEDREAAVLHALVCRA